MWGEAVQTRGERESLAIRGGGWLLVTGKSLLQGECASRFYAGCCPFLLGSCARSKYSGGRVLTTAAVIGVFVKVGGMWGAVSRVKAWGWGLSDCGCRVGSRFLAGCLGKRAVWLHVPL